MTLMSCEFCASRNSFKTRMPSMQIATRRENLRVPYSPFLGCNQSETFFRSPAPVDPSCDFQWNLFLIV